MTKTLNDRIADADIKGNNWLARANLASERGEYEKAERMYEKGQKWLDLSNRLRGNGDGA